MAPMMKDLKRRDRQDASSESSLSPTTTTTESTKKSKTLTLPPINNAFLEQDFQKTFSTAFQSHQEILEKNGASLLTKPFRAMTLSNIFPKSYLDNLKSELLSQTFFRKSNDLYDFYQSEDLKLSTDPHLMAFRETIYSSEFLNMMQSITGIELNDRIDIAGQRYPQHGYLLCHDDDIIGDDEGRRIAFILYLVDESWSEKDGGRLDLFDMDSDKQPTVPTASIIPKFGTFAFFEVTPTSYHQVSEVLNSLHERVSITGWLHGPLPKGHATPIQKNPKNSETRIKPGNESFDLHEWLCETYVSSQGMSQIGDVFADESSIELQKFMKDGMYKKIVEELNDRMEKDECWSANPLGPANHQRYRRLTTSPPALRQLKQLMTSNSFLDYLETISNVSLDRDNAFFEIRRFSHGDYTLLHDHSTGSKSSLQVIFSMPVFESNENNQEWNDSWGGVTHYIAKDEDETLLTTTPRENTLGMVFCDPDTLNFIKYVNQSCSKNVRVEAHMIVYEKE